MCGSAMPHGAVFCVDCGYDARTGRCHGNADRPRRRESPFPVSAALSLVALVLGVVTLGVALSIGIWFLRVLAISALLTILTGLAAIGWAIADGFRGFVVARNSMFSGLGAILLGTIPTALVLPAIQKMRAEAHLGNLREIAIAFHNYHDAMGKFPPAAIRGKDGKALLSWRVVILPYIDQGTLYQQFKLDEPWDSPNNIQLLRSMPATYSLARVRPREPYATCYQVFVGPSTPFEGQVGTTLGMISDGTSNTLLVAEAADAVPWTKPDDLPFVPDGPLPKFGNAMGRHSVAFCDGSVQFLSRGIDDATLRALITSRGGEAIGNLR